jgi:hypothetical protein
VFHITGHVAREEESSAVRKTEGKRKLGRRGVDGRIILIWILKNQRERRGLN